MWAVGENRVTAMKFKKQVFTVPGSGFCTPFFAQMGPRASSIFFRGGFLTPGGPLQVKFQF